MSLWPGFEPGPPVAANLAGAMHHFLSQALDHEFPGGPAVRGRDQAPQLKKVFEVVEPAARSSRMDGSPVDKALRPLVRQIANPLKLGEMGLDATHFVLGQHWKNHFLRKVRGERRRDESRDAAAMDRRTEADGAAEGGREPGHPDLRARRRTGRSICTARPST